LAIREIIRGVKGIDLSMKRADVIGHLSILLVKLDIVANHAARQPPEAQ
jgi:hypothetical protein